MRRLVLIHGAWHGAWCWAKVGPMLEGGGYEVDAPDLPGHGDDPTPVADATMDSYVERVVEVLDRRPEPVVLVGHSFGGVVVTQTAEACSERIAALVYVCAFLPVHGQSLFDLGRADRESLLRPLVFSEDRTIVMIREEVRRDALYGWTPAADAAWALARMRPEPARPFGTPVHITEDRFGRIPRTYIHCLRDRGVGPALQRRMVEATPCETVSMDTDHSPFLSAPKELAGHLEAVAARVFGP